MDDATISTLQLLAQYNNHINEREKVLEPIEKKFETYSFPNNPSYDQLFKENIKLKLELKEYETEIESLKKTIEHLKGEKSPTINVETNNSEERDIEKIPILPPRSADRKKPYKLLNIELSQQSEKPTSLSKSVTSFALNQHLANEPDSPSSQLPSPNNIVDTLSEVMDNSFQTTEDLTLRTPTFVSRSIASSKLGSPVVLSNSTNTPTLMQSSIFSIHSHQSTLMGNSIKKSEPLSKNNLSNEDLTDNTSVNTCEGTFKSHSPTTSSAHKPSVSNTNNVKSVHSPAQTSLKSDIPLFVQQDEFSTIRLEVISTLYENPEDISSFPNILFSVIDRTSNKEMFKFFKSIDKIYELDQYLKAHVEILSLPPLPEKQLFSSNIPLKVDYRREKLNDYFSSLFCISTLPECVGLKVAQFISTDTAMSPMFEDSLKEGPLLLRRTKTIGSTPWRVRYGIIENNVLQLLDHGNVTESIRLNHSSLELQANLPDDKYGTKNGFIINEHKKSGLYISTKYYLCAETAKERELWIKVVTEMCENPMHSLPVSLSGHAKSETSSLIDQSVSGGVSETNDIIGPMVNLQNPFLSSPTHSSDPIVFEDDKETKRTRMRSFFPFKKLSIASTGNQDVNDSYSLHEESGPDNSIGKSLENMNLSSQTQNVFGSDLKTCLSIASHIYQGQHIIPSVVYRCLEYLYRNHAIEEEGIFRLSGSSSLIKSLQEQFDHLHDVELCNYNNTVQNTESNNAGIYVDCNTVTGLLKLYLRKLPHLIFTDDMYGYFKDIVDTYMKQDITIALKFREIVQLGKIPPENLSLMYVLFELLVKINNNNKVNKMNLRNLCIVFSPTLNIPVNILHPFIADFECIFQGKPPISQDERENIELHIPQM